MLNFDDQPHQKPHIEKAGVLILVEVKQALRNEFGEDFEALDWVLMLYSYMVGEILKSGDKEAVIRLLRAMNDANLYVMKEYDAIKEWCNKNPEHYPS